MRISATGKLRLLSVYWFMRSLLSFAAQLAEERKMLIDQMTAHSLQAEEKANSTLQSLKAKYQAEIERLGKENAETKVRSPRKPMGSAMYLNRGLDQRANTETTTFAPFRIRNVSCVQRRTAANTDESSRRITGSYMCCCTSYQSLGVQRSFSASLDRTRTRIRRTVQRATTHLRRSDSSNPLTFFTM